MSRSALYRFVFASLSSVALASCSSSPPETELTQNCYAILMDWHIAGFWVVNCPVAWVRITNRNPVPVKDPVLQYITYDAAGNPLDHGTYTIEGTIAPGQTKNFIEQYLGLVSLYTERLSVKLQSVSRD